MRPRLILAFAALLGMILAGCTNSPVPADTADAATPPTFLQGVAARVPAYTVDAVGAVDWWAAWVEAHPGRLPTSPGNIAARDAIVQELAGMGLEVEVRLYPVGAAGQQAPPAVPLFVSAVVGTKVGTTQPDHVIGLISHYDTLATTLYGAYDNGSGTAADLATCRTLSTIPMNKTLACIFFDGEEEGTLASREFAKEVDAGKATVHYDFVLGFDMTGINWPGHDWKLYNWVGDEFAPQLFPFVNGTLHEVLGFPESGAEAFPFNDRNSDEASFKAIHVPTIRFAGGRTASAYPQYHMPQDTVEFVYEFAGSRANFEQGLGAIIQAASQLVLELDQVSLEDLESAYA